MRKLAFLCVAFALVACGEKQIPLEPEPVGEAYLKPLTVVPVSSQYSARILTPLPGAERMVARAINGHGHVVGSGLVAGVRYPVVWEDGRPHVLPRSGSPWAEGQATDINNTGDIVGFDAVLGGVKWSKGELVDLGIPVFEVEAHGINSRGQIVGTIYYWTSLVETRGFLWTAGQWSELPPLDDSPDCGAADINERGQIVGRCSNRAYSWYKGSVVDLEIGGITNGAVAINSRGQVVGRTQVAENEYHAFMWEKGATDDLPTLGGVWSVAYDINDSGQIVGLSQTPAGRYHAVLWEDGQLIHLGLAGGTNSFAYGIDNGGRIVRSVWLSGESASGGESAVIWERPKH